MDEMVCDRPLGRSSGEVSKSRNLKNRAIHDTTIVDRPRLFAGILPEAYTGIRSAANVKQFTRGEMLYLEGDAVDRIFLLTSGSVKITKLGRGGEEVILRLAVSGDVLGAVGLFSCGMHCTSAEVFRTCRALVWESKAFKGLADQYPMLHQNMVAIVDEHLRELQDRFREVATGRVGPRVALQLLRLLKTLGQPADMGVEVSLSREEWAQMTGTTLFTVSRLLSAWEASGIVRPRREAVVVCNIPSLIAISEAD